MSNPIITVILQVSSSYFVAGAIWEWWSNNNGTGNWRKRVAPILRKIEAGNPIDFKEQCEAKGYGVLVVRDK